MAKIFNPPTEIKVPELDFRKMGGYKDECKRFKKKLKEWLVMRNPKGKNVGEVIKFAVADGYAEYMVANMKPVELVHLPLMDEYSFQYVHLLTAKEVQASIDREKAIEELFAKRK
jgi:hypothetical protein